MSSCGKGIDELNNDDDLEGSRKELSIFKEVFFGFDSKSTTKRCLVTGAIVFEPALSKHADMPLSSNSQQSAQSSSKGCEVRGDSGLSETCNGITKRDQSSNEQNETAKRMKLSAGRSSQSKVINNGVSRRVTETLSNTITCRLVESSSRGVKYSSYLLKKPTRATREGDSEELLASKSVASPISQESFADKCVVSGPCIPGVDKSTMSHPEGREKDLISRDVNLPGTPGSSNFIKDPRRLIRDQINHLLEAAGWQCELRKRRTSRKSFSYSVYLSPERKSFYEFPKVWRSLGQNLLGKNFKFWQQSRGKHWTDIDQFCSDLSETLMHVNKVMGQSDFDKALADVWILLHPFVVVVFIDKNMNALRKINVVGASKGLYIDNNAKSKISLSVENQDVTGRKMASDRLCDSHLTLETESVVIEGIEEIGHHNGNLLACKGAPGDIRKGRSVKVGGRDTSLDISHQPNESPLPAGFDKDANCKDESLLDLDDVALLHDKRGDVSPSLHVEENTLLQGTESIMCDESSGDGITRKRKMRRKVKKVSEIKGSSLMRNEISNRTSCAAQIVSDSEEIMGDMRSIIEDSLIANECVDLQECGKLSNEQTKDDDLVVYSRSDMNTAKPKTKSQRDRHKLQTLNVATSGHLTDGKYIPTGPRTVLSWLIDTGVVSLNDVIQCRDPNRSPIVVKDGFVTRDGILCRCCNVVFSVSMFKMHSSARHNNPFLYLYLRNRMTYTACLLEAWSAEYKIRKTSIKPSQIEEIDSNDDTCGICGDGGDLICCDGCPSTFHQTCLATQDLPDGNWYCSSCTCRICGDLVSNSSSTLHGLECKQCETKYHAACLKEMGLDEVANSETWFCGRNCEEVYSGLQAQVGIPRNVSNGISWILLRCFHDDEKNYTPKLISLKAACNSRVAVGLSILEESFSAMSDPRTGINMIPHMVYNCRSDFARMDFHGFYTVVLEKDDIVTSIASIRIHGVTIAEMPMVATCSRYRRQGMCRRLMDAVEEMLTSLKIEKLVISALPDLVETWTIGFGFQPLEDYEKASLTGLNLMVLPGTVLLKKPLYSSHVDEPRDRDEPWSGEDCSDRITVTIPQQLSGLTDDKDVQDDNPKGNNRVLPGNDDVESQLQKHFSKITCN